MIHKDGLILNCQSYLTSRQFREIIGLTRVHEHIFPFENRWFFIATVHWRAQCPSTDVKSGFSDTADFATTRTARLNVHCANCHSSFKDPVRDLLKKKDTDPTWQGSGSLTFASYMYSCKKTTKKSEFAFYCGNSRKVFCDLPSAKFALLYNGLRKLQFDWRIA
jgi:hypothetical protein